MSCADPDPGQLPDYETAAAQSERKRTATVRGCTAAVASGKLAARSCDPRGADGVSASILLAQLLELLTHDSRQQPRAGHEHQAQLLKKSEGVELKPVLRHPSIDEPV